MSLLSGAMKRFALGASVCASMGLAVGVASAATPFETDVSTAIDRGIEWLANNGAFNLANSAGDASGLAMLALLEKRASGNPSDPPQGYAGASATDQTRLRNAASYILQQTRSNGAGFYSYRDGQRMFALVSYALTNGPDKSVLAPGNASYYTIKEAMDNLVDKTINAQQKASNGYPNAINQGWWCYNGPGCEDSSTTQFSAAGLHAARTFYLSNKSGDQPYADAARAAAIDAALLRTRTAYELNARQGSDNGSCSVLTATERGHGYRTGFNPSLQQTASGIYIQQFGGADINTPMLQNYLQWLRNHYRWQNLDNMGNSWPNESWSYYMWSSFKGMELLRQAGIAPNAGNLSPNSLGTLPAATAPACAVRQENKDPATLARVPSFGAGAVGYYAAEPKSQYFDYAHQILTLQCYDGSLPINGNDGYFNCNGSPGQWNAYAHQAYQLLVLQRSTGTVIQRCDVDGDGDVDINDINLIRAAIGQVPGVDDVRDANSDGKITINDARLCTQRCTRASCATS